VPKPQSQEIDALRIFVVLNPHSGANRARSPQEQSRRIGALFAALGVEATVEFCETSVAAQCARRSLTAFDAVVAAGGDGTVSGVAAALAGTDLPLGVLPLGTFNHFARDLGLPKDAEDAAHIIAAGRTRIIDVAEVNGRVFVNNAALGFYPQLVVERDHERRRRGGAKWYATALAAWHVLRRLPRHRLRFRTPSLSGEQRTPLLFVGNNVYATDLFTFGRKALDAGELSVYIVAPRSRLGLVALAGLALMGRLDRGRDFRLLRVPELLVETRRRRVRLALDGEPVALEPPLRYRIRPHALRVLAPPAPP
jgi:diacylglycerol kinase family enzyme